MNPDRPIIIVGFPRMLILGVLGGIVGVFIANFWNPIPLFPSEMAPAAYRVPKIPGGTPLSLAMVHDVLHERYLRHGAAWYTQRNADARKIMARETPDAQTLPTQEYLDAMDDLAIGLERTGQFDQAIAVMRGKMKWVGPLPALPADMELGHSDSHSNNPREMEESDLDRILNAQHLSDKQHQQYLVAANLGTILVHGEMGKALAGDAKSKDDVREGLDDIEHAIAINPGAHFGREKWQAIAIEDLLAAMDHPDILTNYDLIGQPLGEALPDRKPRLMAPFHWSEPINDVSTESRLFMRNFIADSSPAPDWAAIVHPDYSCPMPFDEPMLAMIGMWTLGGGPSPHFALSMAVTMEEIGQNNIAWEGYERAAEMKDQFWPDKKICDAMVSICRAEQDKIAHAESSDAATWQAAMRTRHVAELAWGQAYQKAYQDFEADQIKAGVSLDDPNFYKAFFQNRSPIASPPGLADTVLVVHKQAITFGDVLPCIMLGIGIGMLAALVIPEKHLSSLPKGK